MDARRTETVRRRVELSLSPTTAAVAGLSLDQLVQFVATTFAPYLGGGGVTPSDEQLVALARHLGIADRIL